MLSECVLLTWEHLCQGLCFQCLSNVTGKTFPRWDSEDWQSFVNWKELNVVQTLAKEVSSFLDVAALDGLPKGVDNTPFDPGAVQG